MKLIGTTLTLGTALLMVGCASGPIPLYFAPINPQPDPSMSYNKLLSDRYECSQEATVTNYASKGGYNNNYGGYESAIQTTPSCSLFSACLGARGWVRTSTLEGGYHVPDSLAVSCTN